MAKGVKNCSFFKQKNCSFFKQFFDTKDERDFTAKMKSRFGAYPGYSGLLVL